MVTALAKHDVKWLTPSPLWGEIGDLTTESNRYTFVRPSILRFNQDDFMDEVMSLLSYHPDRLLEWQALPETWRKPMSTPPTSAYLKRTQPATNFSKRQNKLARTHGLRDELASNYQAPNGDEIDYKEFKLYQPAHMRYYLVTASLVCRQAGLPDRNINTDRQEQVGYVLRRIVNKDINSDSAWCDPEDSEKCYEFAFVQTQDGPQWRLIDPLEGLSVDRLMPDEERLPLFSLSYADNDTRQRRMLAGMIPVSRREAYLNALQYRGLEGNIVGNESASIEEESDPRVTLFVMDVVEPWKALLEQAVNEKRNVTQSDTVFSGQTDGVNKPSGFIRNDADEQNKRSREQIQTVSWYVLLDFERYLKTYLLPIWEVLADKRTEAQLESDEERDVVLALKNTTLGNIKNALKVNDLDHPLQNTYHATSEIRNSLFDALQELAKDEDESIAIDLEAMEVDYDRITLKMSGDHEWPRFLFPLADPQNHGPAPNITYEGSYNNELGRNMARIDALVKRIDKALLVNGAAGNPEVPSRVSPHWDNREGWFVIRCFYERPNCGPFQDDVISPPTRPFQMAAFFDPDAPGRPIKVPMPLDISPAGLRKFNRNTTFMISDMLCGKLKNMRNMTLLDIVLYVLPWPFHKGLDEPNPPGACGAPGPGFGMFCSLSIPIVTICAMILLIIMVTLFDIFFRWLPFLFVCLPIPGLKGKKP